RSSNRRFALVLARRPPTPTLLPYTTLFRSPSQAPMHTMKCLMVKNGKQFVCTHLPGIMGQEVVDHVAVWCQLTGDVQSRAEFGEDRKSTRLNSSHVKISYAVLCLKKQRARL